MPTRRINLWSNPRTSSTALMYAFAQRPDTSVVDEPLYAHYLSRIPTEADHPGKEEILKSQLNDGQAVIEQVILKEYSTQLVVFKQMTHHLIDLDHDFLSQMENVILIRDPVLTIASYTEIIPNATIKDIGIAMQYELCRELDMGGHLTAILDLHQLLINPEKVLRILCEEKLKIPFVKEMLSWPKGPHPEDGVWAKYWYQNVHRSTGFEPYEPPMHNLSLRQLVLAEECRPYYQYLLDRAIKAV